MVFNPPPEFAEVVQRRATEVARGNFDAVVQGTDSYGGMVGAYFAARGHLDRRHVDIKIVGIWTAERRGAKPQISFSVGFGGAVLG